MIRQLPLAQLRQEAPAPAVQCEHRTVSKDGRIVCSKVARGDNAVSPALCSACPFKAVNCAHLRFALALSSPSPLLVRFNGRTELWNDDPPRLSFQQAACAQRVVPVSHPSACANCPLREPVHASSPDAAATRLLPPPTGKVVPFRRDSLAATG